MQLVTTKFKSGGLHEKKTVATWNLGNHLSICFSAQGNQEKPVSRWPVAGPWPVAGSICVCVYVCILLTMEHNRDALPENQAIRTNKSMWLNEHTRTYRALVSIQDWERNKSIIVLFCFRITAFTGRNRTKARKNVVGTSRQKDEIHTFHQLCLYCHFICAGWLYSSPIMNFVYPSER